MRFLNVAGYRFVPIDDLAILRERLRGACLAAGLRGTVLLAPEGINLFLAGLPDMVDAWLVALRDDARFAGLEVKRSWSEHQPFNRMLVKLKKEIITMRAPQIRPLSARAPQVDAATLKRWLDAGHDDSGRAVALLDTRNAFEVEIGGFAGAIDLGIKSFGEFPERVLALEGSLNSKTVVTFCTGGIRCEKAALYMRDKGFENVHQLDGGILKYFEDVGGAHYRGDCFVFDRRVALTPRLQEAGYAECFNCRAAVAPAAQASPDYRVGASCPVCVGAR